MSMIAQYVHKAIEAATPWLVGTAVGFFLLWLAMLIREKKPFAKELKWFSGLAPLHKFIVVCTVCLFTLWGGSKERGILPSGLIDGISSTMSRVVETIQLRTLPETVTSNAFAVTDFAVDSQAKETAFEIGWASNLFENVDSRNIDLFMSTNLAMNGWLPLGRYMMPQGTNSYAFTVSSNDVAFAYRPFYVDSFSRMAFFRFGLDFDSDGDGLTDSYESFVSFTDPSNPDTDGDGLSDAQELAAGIGTNPLLYDTDGDGVGDGDEIAAGSDPHSADTDGDGLLDVAELGIMTALTGEDFMWFDMSGGTDLLASSSTADENTWPIALPQNALINNVCHTNALVCMNGVVHLLCPTNSGGTHYSGSNYSGGLSNTQWSAMHVTVALFNADLYARTADWGSKILYGSVESGGRTFGVVEYRNVGLYSLRNAETNELLTCQMIVPADETNTVYVSYHCASNTFREIAVAAGVQCGRMRSWKSGETYYNLSWPLTSGFPEDGLTIKYSIGTGTDPCDPDTDDDGLSDAEEALGCRTDPLVADSDGDLLLDAEEIAIGTDPMAADSDGDGMPDGWEVLNGLDPLADDAADDPDGDGLSNLREYALGTSPASVDTDGDGLADRAEVGWWEYADSMPVFDVSGGTNLLKASRAYYSDTFKVPLPFTVRSAGYVHTNMTVGVCGMIGLMSDRKSDYSFSVSSSNYDLSDYRVSYYHTAVAAYWDYLCSPANSGAQITVADVETNGLRYAVVEYSNIRLYSQRNDASCVATFQIVIPEAETNTVYVHYIDLPDAFDGSSATIGAQLPSREQTHLVSFDTAGAVTNGMVVAYHLGTGSNPAVADTDGDGLDDGTEATIGTSTRYADTDLDGLTDAWENANGLDPLLATDGNGADGDPDGDYLSNAKEFEYGTDPSVADTDGDGLCDGQETGSVFATNAIPWLSFDFGEDLTTEMSTNYRRCISRPTPLPLRIQGEVVTNLTISANGLVFLNKAGHANSGDSTSGSNFKYAIDEDAIVLAPYLQYAHIRSDVEGRCTSIKFGTATCDGVGYLLVEYLNSYYDTSTWQTNSISFQLAIPTNTSDRAYSRYSDVSGQYMDGRNASIGMQTFNGRWLHSWCYHSEGRVGDGLALEFLFGANSDPLVADTDVDGLSDGQEALVGTSPAKADTDGDGLPDGWEVQHGLNPLSADGNDGDAGDPDGDGVDNLNEYELGTDPNLLDTDGDGLSDGEEAVCISFASPLPWMEFTTLTNLTDAITNSYNNCISIGLPTSVTVQQETVTNITIDARGVVYFNKTGYANPECSRSVCDFDYGTADTNCFTVAPYWSYIFLSNKATPSSVKFGMATVGTNDYYVLECLNLYKDLNSYETNSISFQMAFSTGHVDRICVRYAELVGDEMDGRNASIGFQSFNEQESVSYCSWDYDMVYDGLALSFVTGYGSNPLLADTDGDGISDGAEVNTYGSNPKATDSDMDGLPDAQEVTLGTSLNNPDTDGDGLLDGWEVANNLNPLSAVGDDGASADIDGDGLTNLQEQSAGSNPRNADTDGDGLSDSAELTLGTNPTLADTDNDGLSDGAEQNIGSNPLLSDTDGDGMNDGWESQHDGFDPTVDNSTDTNPNNDLDADSDGDGLTNGEESEAGTNPGEPDTDGDGLNDGVEIGQGSDPNDRADTIPVKWVSVTGDLEMEQIKQTQETVTIPAGTMAYIGVFVHSQEYPHWTGQQSQYNDVLYWNIQADGQTTLRNTIHVNAEEVSWENAALQGWSVNGFTPVAHKGGAIYRAGGSDLNVAVTLRAMNVRDDILPSSVIVGVFPLKVVQANMPTGTGVANTTDEATSYVRTIVPTNGIAYITAHPAAPQLTAEFKDLPQWIDVTWSGSLATERADRSTYDNRTLVEQVTHGGEAYNITTALNNEIVGGRCALNVSVDGVQIEYPFSIRGKNPLDATARTYISSNVGTDFQDYAWMIAKLESKPSNAPRYYNQFNPSEDSYKELPFKGEGTDNWGWGIGQIDRGQANNHTHEIYDWHQNVAAMNAKLNDSLATYNRFVGYFRDLYMNDPTTQWFEPDTVTTNISGVAVSAQMWSVLTFYNGTGGCPRLMLAGRQRQVPLEFNPVTTNWVLHVNSQNYVYKVVSRRNAQQTE